MNYYNDIFICGQSFFWSSEQNSQHPHFVLICDKGEIWVEVEDTYDKRQVDLYIRGKEKFPVNSKTAEIIIAQIIEKNYLESYFTNTDIGLVLTETGSLEEY